MKIKKEVLDQILHFTKLEQQPFYLYDSSTIKDHCREFKKIPYPHKSIHFASMANVNPDFLRIVKSENINVFVNSSEHLKLVQDAGFAGDEIIFTASGMDVNIMKTVKSSGAQLNLDSQLQLKTWQDLFPETKVGIRCNIGDKVKPHNTRAGYFIGEHSRLGFTIEEISEIKNKDSIRGLHLYVGTDIFELEYFLNCYKQLAELSYQFKNLEYLNFGGGFGVDENAEDDFDLENYGIKVSKLMDEVSIKHGRSIKMILEPGRIIGSSAGYFICRVTDIKKRNGNILLGVNASSVQFPRPLFYPDTAKHPAIIVRRGEILSTPETHLTSVYGCSTYSRDFLTREIELPPAEIGDTVVLGNAGSYSLSSFTQFLGFPKPKEFFI